MGRGTGGGEQASSAEGGRLHMEHPSLRSRLEERETFTIGPDGVGSVKEQGQRQRRARRRHYPSIKQCLCRSMSVTMGWAQHSAAIPYAV
jgi:hypothetical protein